MNALGTLIHNGSLIRRSEQILNDYLDLNKENHKTCLYIENPDGTCIRLQPGFKIKDYEIIDIQID